MRILLIAANSPFNENVKKFLLSCYIVDIVKDLEDAFYQACINSYVLIVLNLGSFQFTSRIVKQSAPLLCSQLRNEGILCPILIIASHINTKMIIEALDQGADDYLIEPINLNELAAKIRSLLRRSNLIGPELKPYHYQEFSLYSLSGKVLFKQQEIELCRKEYMILELLLRARGRIVTKEMILEQVWDCPENLKTNSLEVHISRLRKKIEKKFNIKIIKTIPGRGYQLGETA